MDSCSVATCDLPAYCRSWCRAHYYRLARTGSLRVDEPVKRMRPRWFDTEEQAFRWFMPGEPPLDECWDWTSTTSTNGYGCFSFENKSSAAHRAAYRIFIGPLNEGDAVLHSCDRPVCVNPNHLRAGGLHDNMRDCLERGRFPIGEGSSKARMTEAQARWAKAQTSLTHKEMAQIIGVSRPAITALLSGRTWKHLGT